MEGYYYWDIKKKEWHWHIDYMRVEVAAGKCKHKGELEEIMKANGFASWNKVY